jgi:hypothetical protein
LESAGHRVRFACAKEMSHRPRIDEHETILKLNKQENPYSSRDLWRPSSPTVVYVGTVPFGLAVIERQIYTRIRIQASQDFSPICGAYVDGNKKRPVRPFAARRLFPASRHYLVHDIS